MMPVRLNGKQGQSASVVIIYMRLADFKYIFRANILQCNIRYLFMQLSSDIYRHTDNVKMITESDILYYM